MSLAVELACSGFSRSLRFYTDVLGFTTMRFQPEQRRAEVERDGVLVILREGSSDLAPMEYPCGRGVTLVVWINDLEAVYAGVQAYGARLHRPLHTVWQEEDGQRMAHDAFEVIDPDGYAVRFCQPAME